MAGPDHVDKGLVVGNGVERGNNAEVRHDRAILVGVAVATERNGVHDSDINDRFVVFFEIIGDGSGGFGHGFNEINLLMLAFPAEVGILGLATRMNVGFAVATGDADGLVFEIGTKTTHDVAFGVGEVDNRIVVFEMVADEVVFEIFAFGEGNFEFAVCVHDVDVGEFGKAMIGSDFEVVFGSVAFAWIGGVAFDDGAMELFDEWADEAGFEVAFGTGFASADFDADFAWQGSVECFVNTD